jgi:Tol biopolymer transport system component
MRKRFCSTLLLTAMCLVTGLVTGVGSAQATYPGTNGRLAFGLDTGDGNVDVYSVKPSGNALRRLTQAPSFDACPAYSADGTSIAFCSARSGTLEIWTMNANGTYQHQLTHTGRMAGFPDYSPDGARIAFFGRLPGDTNDDVFVVNSDGTGLVRLTSDPGNDQYPAWSPDGSKLAFLNDRSGVAQVWVMDADGGNPQQSTTDPAPKDQVPDWSPDGTKIAYASFATGGGDIYVMHADGSGQTRLTTDPARDLGPAWSPDGTKIAFLSARDLPAARNVYVMNADGGDQHPVHPGGVQFVPAWQPLPLEESDRMQ